MKRFLALFLIAAVIVSCFPAMVFAGTPVNIVVDLSNDRGTYVRMEEYGNLTGKPQGQYGNARQNDLKFMNQNGLNGKVMRMWVDLQDFYNGSTYIGWDHTDNLAYKKHFDDVSQNVDKLLVCMMHPKNYDLKGEGWGPNTIRDRYVTVATDMINRWPKVKYLEVVNEPDLDTSSFNCTPSEYYTHYYTPHYKAVKILNTNLGLTGTSRELLLGGPVTTMYDESYITAFLDAYRNDGSADKRLDFITFHNYMGSHKGDPKYFQSTRAEVRSWLSSRNLDPEKPIFITETGVFAGNQKSSLSFKPDLFIEAAGIASLNYHYIYAGGSQVYPFMWVPRHTQSDNWRKNTMVTDNMPTSITNKFTPYGNMFKMFAMMRDNRVGTNVTPTEHSGVDNSRGVYAMGTKDTQGATAMVWNYQYDASNTSYDTTITINNLYNISAFSGKDAQVKLYMIDDTHGNYLPDESAVLTDNGSSIVLDKSKFDLDNANLKCDSQYVTAINSAANGSITINHSFGRNRLLLIDVQPARERKTSVELAKYRPATSSTTEGFPASYAVDVNADTRWAAPTATAGHYMTVDLGFSAKLTNIETQWYNAASRAYKYILYGSNDNVNYTTLLDKSNNTTKGISYDNVNATARYVRVKVVGCDTAGIDASITEFKVFGAEGNIALGKTATATSNSAEASNAIDNSDTTRWGASNGNFPNSLTIDLGAAHNVTDVETLWYEGTSGVNQRLYTYKIETSTDGSSYTLAYDGSNNQDFKRTYSPIARSARYVKITATGCSDDGYASIMEARVYGYR